MTKKTWTEGSGDGRDAGAVSQPDLPSSSRQAGNQTFARGLAALLAVVESPGGMTVQGLATELGVHRSIAYRILQTLMEFRLVSFDGRGLYRGGSRLPSLAGAYLPSMRATALPIMQELADRVGASVALFVVEGDSAVAIEMAQPRVQGHHISFKTGERTTLEAGAAAYALRAADPPSPDDSPAIQRARATGYVPSHGEVEHGAHAVAAAIPGTYPRACLNLVTHLQDRSHGAGPSVLAAAEEVAAKLR